MQFSFDSFKRYIQKVERLIPEGSISKKEFDFFVSLLKKHADIQDVGEIGFNVGFSSYAFLSARDNIQVTSFDIGTHKYVKHAKEFIDARFSGRHTLVRGNSLKTVPSFVEHNPNTKFGLIFIDGGHDYHTVITDLHNMKKLATQDTIVVMDDLTPWEGWGRGPTKAWREAVGTGLIREIGVYKNGVSVKSLEGGSPDRIWGVGCYQELEKQVLTSSRRRRYSLESNSSLMKLRIP
ncbi:class I SAM-dependent methyltransferase [Patescibacteria group bacterium]|nr:class I SAM-dependent methyltransferase [Patescibacteria group bacterium]